MESRTLILIVVFLSTIIVVAVLLYLYFRQVQNKVMPQDAQNDAWAEYSTRKNRQLSSPPTAPTVISRLLLFCSTYVGAIVLFMLFPAIQDKGLLESLGPVLLAIVTNPFILLLFPLGVAALFVPAYQEGWIGYVLYLILYVLGVFVTSRRAFIVIYLSFIALLIMNAAGCSKISLRDM